jgi:hypothetical protein
MRLLCEIAIFSALIYLAWDKPFHDWLPNSNPPVAVATPPLVQPTPTPMPSPAGTNDAARRTLLDRTTPTPLPAKLSPTPKPTSWLFDPGHRSPLDPPKASPNP